jgi:predicted HTH transcriptional regulator
MTSNHENRELVKKIMRDPRWRNCSDRVIARKSGISRTTVGKVRKELNSHPWRSTPQPEQKNRKLNLEEYIKEQGRVTARELERQFSWSPDLLRQQMHFLEQRGLVTYSPRDRVWYSKGG